MSKLDEMCQLLSDRKHWTQRAAARDRSGHEVEPTNKRAVKFCLLGALTHVNGNIQDSLALDNAVRKYSGKDTVLFNDTSTHRQVMDFCKTLV